MIIDVGFLKDIDFTNPDNLVFFVIFVITVVIILFIVGWFFVGIVRMIRRLIVHFFNIEVKRPEFNKKSTEWLHKEETAAAPQPKIPPVEFTKLSEEKPEEKLEETAAAPKPKIPPVGFTATRKEASSTEKRPEKEYKEKEQKDIEEGLARLKAEGQAEGETLESKMPPREEKTAEEKEAEKFEPIKIPTPRHPSVSGISSPKESVKPTTPLAGSITKTPGPARGGISEVSIPVAKESRVSDSSIFGGKSEISREDLQSKLKGDAKVWRTAEQEGLNLSATERSALVKKIFSPVYGKNISKSDLRQSIQKLNQKLSSAQSSTEHAKISKEIKFFKKIGGIK